MTAACRGRPEQELLKAKLTLRIYRLIKRRGVTQAEAGKIRSGASSVERLMDFIIALGQDVQITVRPKKGSSAFASGPGVGMAIEDCAAAPAG